MQIIIDGYNLLHNSPKYSSLAHQDLERARQSLLTDLSLYGRQRKHKITVVFDGWQGGPRQESRTTEQRVSVIYSPLGERADEVIRRIALAAKKELLIVTSDQGIIQTLEAKRVLAIVVEDFLERMQDLGRNQAKEYDAEPELVKSKKGNPRKLPKAQRKKLKHWAKI